MKVVPALLVVRHRHDGVDRFACLDGKKIHHRLAKRLRRRLRKLVAFQLIDHASRGEEQNRRMRIGDKQPGDEILVPCLHAGAALATTTLRPVDRQRHPLDVAAVADRNDHILLLDQVFVVLIDQMIGNFGTAVIRQPLTRRSQLLENDIVYTRCRPKNVQIIGNLVGKLTRFIGEFLALHAGQPLQPQIENGPRLCFGQPVMAIQNLMPGIVDQPDERLDLGGWPCLFAKLVAGSLGIGRALDQLDDLVNRCQRHHQASQHMSAIARLAKEMDRPPCHHFPAEVAECGDHILQPHLFRTATIHRQHIHREAGLQPCMAIELVQHDIANRVTPDLDNDPHAGAIGLIADVGNALNGLFADKLADPLQQLCLVHLIGDFRDDDGLPVLAVGHNFCACTHHHRPATGGVGVTDAGPAHDQGTGREIRPRHNLQQLLDVDLGIADKGLTGGNHLAGVMRRDIGGHADGNAIGAIHQQVRIFRRQNGRFKLCLVVILREIDRVLVDVTEQAFRRPRQS